MQVTHDEGSPPTLPIPGIGDHATASTLYSAIVTGLYHREKTGKGSHVTTSLIAEGAWAAARLIEGGLHGAKFFGQHNRKTPPNALLNPYRTADGRWLLLVAAQQKDWPGFVKVINMPELLEDPRFVDGKARAQNAQALVEILDPLFASRPLAHWKKALDAGRVNLRRGADCAGNNRRSANAPERNLSQARRRGHARRTHGGQPHSDRGAREGGAVARPGTGRAQRRSAG